MNLLKLSSGSSLEQIEKSMHQVVNSGNVVLQLPKDFVGKRLGALHDAARLQLLATWARLATGNHLQYHNANNYTAVLNELCEYAPGITVLRICNGIIIEGDSLIRRREAIQTAAYKIQNTDQQNWAQIIKGRTIDIPCISGSKIQYLRPFFTERSMHAVKDKQEMFILLMDLSKFLTQNDAIHLSERFLHLCAIFISELIKNTQEHATRDHIGQPYIEHVEGLIMSWTDMKEKDYKADFQGHPKLRKFWDQAQVQLESGTNILRCLQLSFFDTGPGFASRATGKLLPELSLDEERNSILNSLKKNATTKSETGTGNGIPEVLEALRKVGGLITIRSGRLRIFKSFNNSNNEKDMFQFDDWSDIPLAPATGAVISFIIPINPYRTNDDLQEQDSLFRC